MNNFYNKYLKFSIQEIALAGMFMGLFFISGIYIIKIKGVMEIGLSFVFFMLFGLIFGPIKGVLIAVATDTINSLIHGIGYWMWQYALIAVGIPLLAYFWNTIMKLKNQKWIIINIIVAVFIFVSFIVAYIIDKNLTKYSKFSFTIIIILLMVTIVTLFIYVFLFYFYVKNKNEKIKYIISFFSLSVLVIVIFSWIWGTYAFIQYFNRFVAGPGQSYTVAGNYSQFLIPRIIKTFFILPIYTFLISSIHFVIRYYLIIIVQDNFNSEHNNSNFKQT